MGEILLIAFGALLINNVICSKVMGICPFVGVSKKTESAVGMGFAVTFVMAISSVLTYVVYTFVLVPLHIEYLQTIAFIFLIAGLVQIVEMFIKKFSPTLYKALGVYLPLITTNCAVLGIALMNITESYNLLQSFVNGTFSGLGFLLAILLMAGIREKLDRADIPNAFKGFPVSLLVAGIMCLAFTAFMGII